MKKLSVLIFILMLIPIIACKQQLQEPQKPSETQTQQPEVTQTTGDAATDSFGNDMGSVSNEDKELSSNELEGIEYGFNDVENI